MNSSSGVYCLMLIGIYAVLIVFIAVVRAYALNTTDADENGATHDVEDPTGSILDAEASSRESGLDEVLTPSGANAPQEGATGAIVPPVPDEPVDPPQECVRQPALRYGVPRKVVEFNMPGGQTSCTTRKLHPAQDGKKLICHHNIDHGDVPSLQLAVYDNAHAVNPNEAYRFGKPTQRVVYTSNKPLNLNMEFTLTFEGDTPVKCKIDLIV